LVWNKYNYDQKSRKPAYSIQWDKELRKPSMAISRDEFLKLIVKKDLLSQVEKYLAFLSNVPNIKFTFFPEDTMELRDCVHVLQTKFDDDATSYLLHYKFSRDSDKPLSFLSRLFNFQTSTKSDETVDPFRYGISLYVDNKYVLSLKTLVSIKKLGSRADTFLLGREWFVVKITNDPLAIMLVINLSTFTVYEYQAPEDDKDGMNMFVRPLYLGKDRVVVRIPHGKVLNACLMTLGGSMELDILFELLSGDGSQIATDGENIYTMTPCSLHTRFQKFNIESRTMVQDVPVILPDFLVVFKRLGGFLYASSRESKKLAMLDESFKLIGILEDNSSDTLEFAVEYCSLQYFDLNSCIMSEHICYPKEGKIPGPDLDMHLDQSKRRVRENIPARFIRNYIIYDRFGQSIHSLNDDFNDLMWEFCRNGSSISHSFRTLSVEKVGHIYFSFDPICGIISGQMRVKLLDISFGFE
jgi:hypothetical protein